MLNEHRRPWVALFFLLVTADISSAENRVERTELKSVGDIEISIPLITIHGDKPGPTLAITAGIHGAEYAPILAIQALLPLLKTAPLSGTLKIVPVANKASFYKRTIYYGPFDWKNLNRSFPGNASGSYTERLAYLITSEVIEKCDYFLDIHAGDANEALISYAAYDADTEDKAQREKSAAMARALNFPRIIRGTKRPRNPSALLYTTNTARDRGKPNAAIESGELGRGDSKYVEPIVSGVQNLMRSLAMLPGRVTPSKNALYIDVTASVTSEWDGIYASSKRAGDFVRKGDPLGTVTNLFGERLAVVKAPMDGVVLYILGTPPVSKTENIATLGRVTNAEGEAATR